MAMADKINPQVVARFENQRTPRYTSYPTAPHFTDAIADPDYRRMLGELPAKDPLSLYLHVPFCRSLCWYCGCHTKIASTEGPIQSYLDDLEREIAMVASALSQRMTVRHIHWGGGTPAIMGATRFLSLMDLIRHHFHVLPDAEIAIEIDPRRIDEPMIHALGSAGVTRASLGIQSFDPRVQEAINRVQSFEQTARACDGLRRSGIRSINVDLIYGLPYQTVNSCETTVIRTLPLEPDQFSVFGYAHVPWVKKHQRVLEEHVLPGSSERLSQVNAIADRLTGSGYRQIGLDHFARPGDRLDRCRQEGTLHRNFQGYTNDPCTTLLGFGASAIGTLPGAYVQNTTNVGNYRRQLQGDRLAVERGRRLSQDDQVRRDVIERMMCNFSVDLGKIISARRVHEGYFASELERLRPLEREGVVEIGGSRVTVVPAYRALVRTVASVFDAYLRPEDASRHAKAI